MMPMDDADAAGAAIYRQQLGKHYLADEAVYATGDPTIVSAPFYTVF